MKRLDLTGQRFGMLTVIEQCGKDRSGKNVLWLCVCDCGGNTTTTTTHLRSGHTQSCGCMKKEHFLEGGKKTRFKVSHNLSFTRVYQIWSAMKARCYNKNAPKYHLYGDRGIRICDEWLNDVQAFYDWAIANGMQIT